MRLKEVSPATVNRGTAVLKHMLSLAVEREYVDVHPLHKYRLLPEVQEVLRVMTYDEYRRLLNAVAEKDLVIGALTAILGETGMRRSEGLRMRWSDIHFSQRVVLIGKAKSGSGMGRIPRSSPLQSDPVADQWSRPCYGKGATRSLIDPDDHEVSSFRRYPRSPSSD